MQFNNMFYELKHSRLFAPIELLQIKGEGHMIEPVSRVTWQSQGRASQDRTRVEGHMT